MTARGRPWFFVPVNKVGSNEVADVIVNKERRSTSAIRRDHTNKHTTHSHH